MLEVAKVRILEFTVQDTNTESVDRLEAGLQVEVFYDTTYFTCTPENLLEISTTSWKHPRSYLFNASITQNDTPTKTIINQNGFTATSYTTNLSAAIDKSVESITVASVGSITANCYLQIGDEVLEVTQINGSALTVKRGRMGSKAIAHVVTDSITLLHSLTVSSVSSLGIGINEYLQIDNEIFLVAAIQESAHQLLVIGAQLGTTATAHDNRATVTHYPCWVNANLEITDTSLVVTSAQALGVAVGDYLQIEDEVLLVDAIDSDTQLTVTRQQKGSTAAAHAQGTGMYIHSRGTLEIDDRYDYTYEAKNAIGQWEDWEASLAVEFTPSSESSGALLTTDTAEKLNRLNPSKQGLSAEAWIKPTDIIGNTGDTSTVLYHKNVIHRMMIHRMMIHRMMIYIIHWGFKKRMMLITSALPHWGKKIYYSH